MEQHAKLAALELLDLRGVPVFEESDGVWGRKYVIKENLKPTYAVLRPKMGGFVEGDTYVAPKERVGCEESTS